MKALGVPDLQQIEENVRFRTKSISRRGNPQGPSQVRIGKMSRDEEGKYFYLATVGELDCFMGRNYLLKNFPDELIRFYESKI